MPCQALTPQAESMTDIDRPADHVVLCSVRAGQRGTRCQGNRRKPQPPRRSSKRPGTRLLEDGYAGLSTCRVSRLEAGVPLSQVHYHFGSKGGMVLALLEAENARRLSRQTTLYSQDATVVAPLRASVRRVGGRPRVRIRPLLQEMIAAGWTNPEIAAAARSIVGGWYDLLTDVATEAAERFGGLGPFSPAKVATLIGNAFIGSEALLLLGFDRQRLPIRASLRRLGEVIKSAEEAAEATLAGVASRRQGADR